MRVRVRVKDICATKWLLRLRVARNNWSAGGIEAWRGRNWKTNDDDDCSGSWILVDVCVLCGCVWRRGFIIVGCGGVNKRDRRHGRRLHDDCNSGIVCAAAKCSSTGQGPGCFHFFFLNLYALRQTVQLPGSGSFSLLFHWRERD